MKKITSIAALILFSAGFTFAQNITVNGERKANTDFKKYKTFAWVTNDKPSNQLIEYTYAEVVDPSAMETKAEKKMEKKEMKSEGKKMRHHDKNNKEVVVYSYSFIVPAQDSVINNVAVNSVEDELEGRGYRKDAVNPDFLVAYKIFDSSTKIKGYNEDPTRIDSRTETYTPQDTMTYAVKPGTMFISLVDAKTSSVIWEGYASGVAKQGDMTNDKIRVKEAINLIFKKFEYRGDKYSMNNE